MKPKSYARILEGARRDVRRFPASPEVGEADVHLATRVLADFREVMLEREVSLGAWRGALGCSSIAVAAVGVARSGAVEGRAGPAWAGTLTRLKPPGGQSGGGTKGVETLYEIEIDAQ